MARKGILHPVLKMNIGLDEALLRAVDAGALQNERSLNQEVRFALRKYYGLDRTPAEVTADV